VAELPLPWVDLLVRFDMASSKSEAKRLIQGGGVRLNGDKLADLEALCQAEVAPMVLVQVGKRKAINLNLT
jgi:tyrosyl-tRNA synthetase